MAHITDWVCIQCGSSIHSSRPRNNVCAPCQSTNESNDRKAHFRKLEEMSIEERLRKVEEWQYMHDCDDSPLRYDS